MRAHLNSKIHLQCRSLGALLGSLLIFELFLTIINQTYHAEFLCHVDQKNKTICDFSERRTNVCKIAGDVRIHGASSSIFIASIPNLKPLKLKPHARKWDIPAMAFVKEVILQPSNPQQAPSCSIKHATPGIVFSTGGYTGNIFHDFSDVLIPLFQTSHQFLGEVQLLIIDFKADWIHKYNAILNNLSKYQVIDLSKDQRVHCFDYALVGLRSNKELGIDPSKSHNNYSMLDFKSLMRSSYNLDKVEVTRAKPVLLLMSRNKTRTITNEGDIATMAQSLGYTVKLARPEEMSNLPSFALTVNHCDVLLSISGAGLTNMVFLPNNATLIAIVPWGLKWVYKNDYGDPATGMGIKTLDYYVTEEESSLVEQYPRDNEVFKDPYSYIDRHGWQPFYDIFLAKQNVTVNLDRFRGVLLEAHAGFSNW